MLLKLLFFLLFFCEESPSVTSRFARRTHTCGDLNEGIIGQEVHLCGWVELKRLGRFLTLRDGYGAAQLVAPNNVSTRERCSECIIYQTLCSGSCLYNSTDFTPTCFAMTMPSLGSTCAKLRLATFDRMLF